MCVDKNFKKKKQLMWMLQMNYVFDVYGCVLYIKWMVLWRILILIVYIFLNSKKYPMQTFLNLEVVTATQLGEKFWAITYVSYLYEFFLCHLCKKDFFLMIYNVYSLLNRNMTKNL